MPRGLRFCPVGSGESLNFVQGRDREKQAVVGRVPETGASPGRGRPGGLVLHQLLVFRVRGAESPLGARRPRRQKQKTPTEHGCPRTCCVLGPPSRPAPSDQDGPTATDSIEPRPLLLPPGGRAQWRWFCLPVTKMDMLSPL